MMTIKQLYLDSFFIIRNSVPTLAQDSWDCYTKRFFLSFLFTIGTSIQSYFTDKHEMWRVVTFAVGSRRATSSNNIWLWINNYLMSILLVIYNWMIPAFAFFSSSKKIFVAIKNCRQLIIRRRINAPILFMTRNRLSLTGNVYVVHIIAERALYEMFI